MPKLPKIRISVESLRWLQHSAFRFTGLFVNLDDVHKGLLDSRIIEYPFVLRKLTQLLPGKVLDVGCTDGGNFVAPTLAYLGWQVYGVDNREFRFEHPNFHFLQEDIRHSSFPDNFFDVAYAVSTLEHIGIAGRYGVREEDPEGDLRAVMETERLLRPGGTLVITVPYGQAAIVRPFNRVYDRARLQRLIGAWLVKDEAYWLLNDQGRWQMVSEELAAKTEPCGVAVAMLELQTIKAVADICGEGG